MRILFLDQATVTGWCFDPANSQYGHQDFSLKRGESPGMRYIRFAAWLREMVKLLKPEIICYEQGHNRGGAPTEIAYGLIGQIKVVCAEESIETGNVQTSSLKKFWTGNGRAGKEDMIAICDDKGFHPEDDNEADAIAGWHWAQREYGAKS